MCVLSTPTGAFSLPGLLGSDNVIHMKVSACGRSSIFVLSSWELGATKLWVSS